MTEPQSETTTPAPVPRNTRATQAENTAPASGGKYLVKTPWTCSEFHVGETVVTPDGVELDASTKDEVVAASKAVRMKLTVEEAGN